MTHVNLGDPFVVGPGIEVKRLCGEVLEAQGLSVSRNSELQQARPGRRQSVEMERTDQAGPGVRVAELHFEEIQCFGVGRCQIISAGFWACPLSTGQLDFKLRLACETACSAA